MKILGIRPSAQWAAKGHQKSWQVGISAKNIFGAQRRNVAHYLPQISQPYQIMQVEWHRITDVQWWNSTVNQFQNYILRQTWCKCPLAHPFLLWPFSYEMRMITRPPFPKAPTPFLQTSIVMYCKNTVGLGDGRWIVWSSRATSTFFSSRRYPVRAVIG